MHDSPDNKWLCIELTSIEYMEAWKLQTDLVAARKDKIIDTNVILLLEHPPVFTLGRRGGLSNLTVSEDYLEKAGIPIIQVERGGNITFHEPGQLVMYPIVDLNLSGLRVVEYVENLEEVMIRSAFDWGIKAERNPINRGIWVGNNKLGSIGIAIRRGICFHGIAFNVNCSLKPCGWINPCGLQDVGMTSIEREVSHKVSINEVRDSVKRHVQAVFGVELVMTNLIELQSILATDPHGHTQTFSLRSSQGKNSHR